LLFVAPSRQCRKLSQHREQPIFTPSRRAAQ
jgi:hypothetical protein